MRLLLDAMYAPQIAVALRSRGYEVESALALAELRAASDRVIFVAAQSRGCALVTEDRLLRVLAAEFLDRGATHHGLVLTHSRVFPRSHPRTLGRLITALAALLDSDIDLRGREHWLRPPDEPSEAEA